VGVVNIHDTPAAFLPRSPRESFPVVKQFWLPVLNDRHLCPSDASNTGAVRNTADPGPKNQFEGLAGHLQKVGRGPPNIGQGMMVVRRLILGPNGLRIFVRPSEAQYVRWYNPDL